MNRWEKLYDRIVSITNKIGYTGDWAKACEVWDRWVAWRHRAMPDIHYERG